jgi:hypothetical protein
MKESTQREQAALNEQMAAQQALKVKRFPAYRLLKGGPKAIFYRCTFCKGVVDSNFADTFETVEEITEAEFEASEVCAPALAEMMAASHEANNLFTPKMQREIDHVFDKRSSLLMGELFA